VRLSQSSSVVVICVGIASKELESLKYRGRPASAKGVSKRSEQESRKDEERTPESRLL